MSIHSHFGLFKGFLTLGWRGWELLPPSRCLLLYILLLAVRYSLGLGEIGAYSGGGDVLLPQLILTAGRL